MKNSQWKFHRPMNILGVKATSIGASNSNTMKHSHCLIVDEVENKQISFIFFLHFRKNDR